MNLWLKIIICVVAIQLTGALSGLLGAGSIGTWFADLTKPAGNPPNWIFGPVWTVLYGLMGLALARVWHSPPETPGRRAAIITFLIQMALNLAWPPAAPARGIRPNNRKTGPKSLFLRPSALPATLPVSATIVSPFSPRSSKILYPTPAPP